MIHLPSGSSCQYGRAARHKIAGQHVGERKCPRKATTSVRKPGWYYWYCDEHALAIAPTAPREWLFDGPVNIERARDETTEPRCTKCGQTIYRYETFDYELGKKLPKPQHARCPRA